MFGLIERPRCVHAKDSLQKADGTIRRIKTAEESPRRLISVFLITFGAQHGRHHVLALRSSFKLFKLLPG